MKTLGLIGGTSWASTQDYYKLINEGINRQLGKKHSAKILLHSVDFEEEYQIVTNRGWDAFLDRAEYYARNLHRIGADGIMLCANTLHIIAEKLQKRLELPIIDITEATAKNIRAAGIQKVGLLGTKFTMQTDFYPDMLSRDDIECLVPAENEIHELHEIIFSELIAGVFKPETRERILEMIRQLEHQGVRGIILGCTELPMIIKKEHSDLTLFDTLKIHAQAAVDFALSENDHSYL